MKELVFALELHGRIAPVEGREGVMSVRSVGRGQAGETVRFTSEVVRSGSTATEVGRIEYGGRGAIEFNTVGALHVVQSPLPGSRWGAAIWNITKGDGEFSGATGFITSNFLVSVGELIDNQYARIVLP
jgi:hypothetical protein